MDINSFITDLVLYLNNKYIAAAVIFAGFFIVSQIAVVIIEKIIMRFTRKTKTNVDDMIIDKINKPISIMLVFIGMRIGLATLDLHDKVSEMSNKIVLSVIFVLVAYMIIGVIGIIVREWGRKWAAKTESTIDDHIIAWLDRSINIIFYIIAILLVLDAWGVQIGPLLASLGIAGIAVAFALQNTLGNIFGGMSLIVDKSFKVGDVIQLDQGTMGTVMDVGLRSTKIRTFDNEVIIMPNGQLANMKIQNFVLPEPKVRVIVSFSVAYGTKVDKVKTIVMKELKSIKECMADPAPLVRFDLMAESGLNFRAFFWVDSYTKRFDVKEEATTKIYNALNKHKISIPYPQMDLHIKKR